MTADDHTDVRWRRGSPNTKEVLLVYLAADGGILTIWSSPRKPDSGRPDWVPEAELVRRLEELAEVDGVVLYSREAPEQDSTPIVQRTFERITEARRPIQLHEGPLKIQAPGIPTFPLHGTTLMFAAVNDFPELAADLLARGADPNATDDDGNTALMYAVQKGSENVVRTLLDGGADPEPVNCEGWTALKVAQHFKRDAIAAMLESHA
jgi:hypothetical protein